jgi:hypothetical protein
MCPFNMTPSQAYDGLEALLLKYEEQQSLVDAKGSYLDVLERHRTIMRQTLTLAYEKGRRDQWEADHLQDQLSTSHDTVRTTPV